jgi:hypothetical protein
MFRIIIWLTHKENTQHSFLIPDVRICFEWKEQQNFFHNLNQLCTVVNFKSVSYLMDETALKYL